MRFAAATTLLAGALTGCGSGSGSTACSDAKSTAQRYIDAANVDGTKAAAIQPSYAADDNGPYRVNINEFAGETYSKDQVEQHRLLAQVIVGNPTCFTAAEKAQATEFLAATG